MIQGKAHVLDKIIKQVHFTFGEQRPKAMPSVESFIKIWIPKKNIFLF